MEVVLTEFATDWTVGISEQLLRRSFHEASHAVVARALEIGVEESLVVADGENDEDEGGHTTFDQSIYAFPIKVETGSHLSEPLALGHPVASRWWVATRAGGVGSVVGMAALGKTVTYDQLMQDTVMSDDAELRDALNWLTDLDRIKWIDQRYAETWGLVVKLQPRIFAVGHRLAMDRQLTGEQIDSILAVDGYADVEQVVGSVVSADDIASGCALARERGLETWPDKTAYLQKLDDWSRASYPDDLSPL